MADYTDNALLSSIKALEQVVLPAVDPADPLAGEQLRLVSGFLKFLRARLHHWHPRRIFELDHYLSMAREMAADARLLSTEVSARMDRAIADAATLRLQRLPPLAELEAATAALASSISGAARVAGSADSELRERVERRVLEGSRRWVDMQRAWFLPQGFDLHPAGLPALEELMSSHANGAGGDGLGHQDFR